jgi:hypothetical protein
MFLILSGLATELPPYFCTTTPILLPPFVIIS